MFRESHIEKKLDELKSFKELFNFINTNKLSDIHKSAYDESVQIAKGLIDGKNKDGWDKLATENDLKVKYPELPEDFISALIRCIEGYNPPVNIPNEPLW